MVSALVSGSGGLAGFEPWPGTLCRILGQDTLPSHCLSPLRCIIKWVPANVMLEVTLRWSGIPSREE